MLTERYRPETLDNIIGQQKAVKTLQKWAQIADRGALIFEGPSGVGKTSAAYALARQLGVDPKGPDFRKIEAQECDVRTVRELDDKITLSSWGKQRWRVWLIDEAHTMSRQARNRMLSLLENLPPYRLVVLTTTEYGPFCEDDPILFSRLLRVHFVKPHIDGIVALLERIALEVTGNGEALPYEQIVRNCRSNIRLCIQELSRRILELD